MDWEESGYLVRLEVNNSVGPDLVTQFQETIDTGALDHVGARRPVIGWNECRETRDLDYVDYKHDSITKQARTSIAAECGNREESRAIGDTDRES
jgi:hypothetical protein